MDEMVTANLGFSFLLPLPSPARTIPSPALIIPFSDNKLPNKLAPNVLSNIFKNPSLYSLVLFSIIFIISFIFSCSIINLIPSPLIFFCILPSIADIAAVKPNGANTFLANGIATFINGPASLLNKLPKNPPDSINIFI